VPWLVKCVRDGPPSAASFRYSSWLHSLTTEIEKIKYRLRAMVHQRHVAAHGVPQFHVTFSCPLI
jgi:hypothetical protein